ncbi:MAG TPA: 7-carboxy-7-deazaguanine synthase QueE [Thiobacillaceae bacterium]|nr:7-carboxy-7-deazaguanine synthase QueE [Thiobacillaceae bacterium]HNU64394.1 7-carboxy-7-deazaguanine synthase QueE [Thiobacillaceae bacterium]
MPPCLSPARLRVSEIFFSLQGEACRVGLPTVFVRLTGCPLRCHYCDTPYAFQGGEWMELEGIVSRVRSFATRHVTVTGGEPLAQQACGVLLGRLCDLGMDVSLETSGALPITGLDPRVARIVDIKTPGSGAMAHNHWPNLEALSPRDEIKFVLTGEADYQWARAVVAEHDLTARCPVLFSPAWGSLDATSLAEWVIRDGLPVRVQVQLHKILWGEARGR